MDPQVSVAPQGGYVSADVILRYWKNRWKPICYSKKTLTVIVIIILLSSSCSQMTTMPAPTVFPTWAPNVVASDTSEIPSTPTKDVLAPIEHCPIISLSESLPEIGTEGVVVLLGEFNPYSYAGRRAFYLDLETQERIEFSSDYATDDSGMLFADAMAVSPDRTTLAYTMADFAHESVKFVLSNSMGERQKVILFQGDNQIDYMLYFGGVGPWLNNQQISLGNGYIVFNPYTEDVKIYDPKDFPDIIPDDLGIYVIRFDPQVSRVVYSISHARTAVVDLVPILKL